VEWTNDGRIRAPSYKGLCQDEGGIASVPSRELPAGDRAAPDPPPEASAAFGNLDRVLFPEDGITKGDLLDYYRRVAPVLLPHLRDRPFTMRRAPEGIHRPFFWVKDAPAFMPAWIDRVEIPAETRRGQAKETVAYPIIDDVPSLLWMVSMGCIDLHVTLSRAATWRCPDYVLFDLDPCRDASFAAVVRVAHHVRDALNGLGLEAYAKTSGRDGMHVCVPIALGPSFDETRAFAQTVATAVERAYPDEATAAWVKERRHGVFVDWKQNSLAATIVPPYSVRPMPGAPVSCPLRWEEVREDLDPRTLGMQAVLERAERLGDLFAPVLEGGQDLTPFVRRQAPS
jgi:bifunctional non-homologous end joining protein LigD